MLGLYAEIFAVKRLFTCFLFKREYKNKRVTNVFNNWSYWICSCKCKIIKLGISLKILLFQDYPYNRITKNEVSQTKATLYIWPRLEIELTILGWYKGRWSLCAMTVLRLLDANSRWTSRFYNLIWGVFYLTFPN